MYVYKCMFQSFLKLQILWEIYKLKIKTWKSRETYLTGRRYRRNRGERWITTAESIFPAHTRTLIRSAQPFWERLSRKEKKRAGKKLHFRNGIYFIHIFEKLCLLDKSLTKFVLPCIICFPKIRIVNWWTFVHYWTFRNFLIVIVRHKVVSNIGAFNITIFNASFMLPQADIKLIVWPMYFFIAFAG